MIWICPSLVVGNDTVPPVRSVRNLGIYVDADHSLRTHVLKTTSGCFAVLRCIKSIRRSVSVTVLQSLMVALVLSRLDDGSTLLAGLPKQLLDRLQSVQNAAAGLVFAACCNDHITPLLHSLYRLRVAKRITFRLAVLTHRCLHSSALKYLTSLLQCVSGIHTRQRLRSCSGSQLLQTNFRAVWLSAFLT